MPDPREVNDTAGASSDRKACSTAEKMSASATTIGSGVLSPWLRRNSTAMGPERASYSPAAARVEETMTKPVRDMDSPSEQLRVLQGIKLHDAACVNLVTG